MTSPLHNLRDGHGRSFEYLRLSLTDVCNFRCTYCLPDGYRKQAGKPANLSVAEIARLVCAFAALGLWKVRLTGGEPSLRAEVLDIAQTISGTAGIRRLAMTTNGYRLAERAKDYASVGITSLNLSLDSLDPTRFAQITGHDRLPEILAGVDAARDAGIESIKLNAVLMKGINDGELLAFMDFVERHDLSLRFIEVMRTNDNVPFFRRYYLPAATVIAQLERAGWQRLARAPGAGPAIEFAHPAGRGRIGVIAPYAKDFCASCNRLRVSSLGKLHLCLFGDFGVDLRPLLADDAQQDELLGRIEELTRTKSLSHRLLQNVSGATPHLASIGG